MAISETDKLYAFHTLFFQHFFRNVLSGMRRYKGYIGIISWENIIIDMVSSVGSVFCIGLSWLYVDKWDT